MLFKNKKLKLVLTASLVLAVLVILYFTHKPKDVFQISESEAHHGQLTNISLREVSLDAYYFVPKDFGGRIDANWKNNLEKTLESSKKFYEFQTGGAIKINYLIFPKPLIGREDTAFYNGQSSGNGNAGALLAIKSEIELREKTDSNISSLGFPTSKGTFQAMVILYEGVGASSMLLTKDKPATQGNTHVVIVGDNEKPAMLVSNYYLNGQSYKDYGTTIFAHELGHILGLPDSYDEASANVTDDIMGLGRQRPINFTYIAEENLKQLGLNND